jgi:hypothetical protein
MKDKRKIGKQNQKNPAQQSSSPEGPRRKRLKPVDKSKYKLNRYQLSDDFEDEDDLFDEYSND